MGKGTHQVASVVVSSPSLGPRVGKSTDSHELFSDLDMGIVAPMHTDTYVNTWTH